MDILPLIYGILFALTVGSALFVVASRHPVHSALSLVVTMTSIAGIFILINAQLAAVLQIMVYAGAIMVLFLFVIMLLNLGPAGEPPAATSTIRKLAVPMILLFAIQVVLLAAKFGGEMELNAESTELVTIDNVAMVLMTKYIYAFEMTSVMLLMAIVGAMVLARRQLPVTPLEKPKQG